MSEGLRPWYLLGLCHILRDEAEHQALETVHPAQIVTNRPVGPEAVEPGPEIRSFQDRTLVKTSHEAVWERLLLQKAASCKVVFTYWELGQDLCCCPSQERKSFLRQLILSLRQPRGSIGFWPMTVQTGDDLSASESWFWRGVAKMEAQSVICFGTVDSTLHQGLTADSTAGATPVPVFFFPALEELSAMPGQLFLEHYIRLLQVMHIEMP